METDPNDPIEQVRIPLPEGWSEASAETKETLYEITAKDRGRLTKDELMAIDLTRYDQLRTFPGGDTDWQLMRDRVLFLQTAVRAGIPFWESVERTFPYFGAILKPPFEALSEALEIPAYQAPPFDVARQTTDEWARDADEGWRKHRDEVLEQIQSQVEGLVASGKLKLFNRPRVTREKTDKAAILGESIAHEMAVKRFIRRATWVDLVEEHPPEAGYSGSAPEKANQRKKRANQIRRRVMEVLSRLGLPDAQLESDSDERQ